MSTLRITATEPLGSLAALLDRLADQRDEIEIEADGVVLARLVPATARQNGTLEALFGAMRALPRDEEIAGDLEAIQLEQLGALRPGDPWAN